MSYIRMSSSIEYDPITQMIRQDGQERPAGWAGVCYAFREEVLKELGKQAVTVGAEPTAQPEGPSPEVSHDVRDGLASGTGQVTQNGAPRIVPNPEPLLNQYGYRGPAAFNPYFTTPSTPLTPGYVKGFEMWFDPTEVVDTNTGQPSYMVNRSYCATAEGAEEALRLVRLFEPGAVLGVSVFGSAAGPFRANKPTYEIVLPNGVRINAGAILWNYYWGGQGVTASSDQALRAAVERASQAPHAAV